MEVTNLPAEQTNPQSTGTSLSSSSSWEQEYADYLAEKAAAIADTAEEKGAYNIASASNGNKDEEWAVQYAQYCAEKESRLAAEDKVKK